MLTKPIESINSAIMYYNLRKMIIEGKVKDSRRLFRVADQDAKSWLEV